MLPKHLPTDYVPNAKEVTMKSFDYHLLNLPIKFKFKDNKTLVSLNKSVSGRETEGEGTVLDFKALRDIIIKCNGWSLIMHWL